MCNYKPTPLSELVCKLVDDMTPEEKERALKVANEYSRPGPLHTPPNKAWIQSPHRPFPGEPTDGVGWPD